MKKLFALLLAVAMVLSMAACVSNEPQDTGADTTAADDTAASETRENKLIYASSTEMDGDFTSGLFDTNASDMMTSDLLNDYSTMALQRDGSYAYNMTVLAEEPTKTENEDGSKTFTIKIKEGLTYNTGKAITVKDYIFRTMFGNSATCAELGGMGSAGDIYPNGKAFYKNETAVFADLKLIDDYTYTVTISAEYLPYVFESTYAASSPWDVEFWFGAGYEIKDDGEGCYLAKDGEAVMMDAALAEAVSETFTAARTGKTLPHVSAGPYQLVSFDESAKQTTLEINPNYAGNFEGQKPSIQTLVITYTTTSTWSDSLKTGAINMYDSIADGTEVNTVMDMIDSGADLTTDAFSRAGYGKVQFVCDITPTQFVEVRQAIAHLLDREEFVNTFCAGWGSVANGPYASAFWMAEDSKDLFADELNTYAFDVDTAAALLNEGGWTLNADGTEWTGEGLRYKEVTAEQAANMDECVEVDGKILMPLIIKWASSENNPVSDLLTVLLAESDGVKSIGMEFQKDVMDFPTLLGYLYRQDVYGVGGADFTVPHYSMYNLATGWNDAVYDYSFNWTDDPDYVAAAYNTNFLYDLEEGGLDDLSMRMVYGIEEGDDAAYLDLWQQYIIRWNELLPDLPLYCNTYVTAYPTWLEGFDQDSFWGFQYAVLYASIANAE